MNYHKLRNKPKQFLSLTSVTVEEFDEFLPTFEKELRWMLRRTARGNIRKNKIKLPDALNSTAIFLFFTLSDLKINPLQEHHAASFDISQPSVSRLIRLGLQALNEGLRTLVHKPGRDGEEFANLLYHNYPGEDYNDVMDGVDYLVEKGIVDNNKLFVTGGSAGGIMTAWIIGKNNRFKAAVVAKPVMNWISKTLVADNYFGYANSRYPGQPWENFETYWKFSPISLVGNVETPTMVMVGMNDLRTPPSEAKQLYHALKLRKIETVLVEIPEASHGIARKPSNLISKVAHTLAWFEKYDE